MGNPLYDEIKQKLNEASDLSIMAEALIDSGEYDAAAVYNAKVKLLQTEVKIMLSQIEPGV